MFELMVGTRLAPSTVNEFSEPVDTEPVSSTTATVGSILNVT